MNDGVAATLTAAAWLRRSCDFRRLRRFGLRGDLAGRAVGGLSAAEDVTAAPVSGCADAAFSGIVGCRCSGPVDAAFLSTSFVELDCSGACTADEFTSGFSA